MSSQVVAVPLVSSSSTSPMAKKLAAYHVEVIKKHGECSPIETKDVKPQIDTGVTMGCPWSQKNHNENKSSWHWIKTEPSSGASTSVKVKEEVRETPPPEENQMLPPEPLVTKTENFVHPRDILQNRSPGNPQRSYSLSIREENQQNLSEVMPPPEPLIRDNHFGIHQICPVPRGQGKKSKKKEEETDVTSSIPDLGKYMFIFSILTS